ncbi:NmrA family transcriptional regulator [uncultured Nitratireductor sp.]|uniref:NmrA family transcriptional regulator n=1 Tax=uncultured Nitratireductor sp. TaxID=520953 RepID=UPI0025FBA1E0|nr:NmrA family transcriptional regulator [uncultured Nitratireductor sp.]
MIKLKNDQKEPVLVTGGTGKTGRRLAERLEAAGIPVRIGSRSAEIPFEWEKADTWDAALEGVSAAYVAYFPDLAVPGAAEIVEAFAKRAVAKGVTRLVLLSGRGEEGAERAEKLFVGSGADWTILRADWFFQNFSEAFFLDAIRAGELALPVGDVREPFVDVDDIADVAFAALTERGHEGKLYTLTGPRLMSFPEMMREIGAACGREIRFKQIPVETFVESARREGLDEPMIGLLRELFTEVLDGRNESVADGVKQALGRPPRDFSDYVRRTVATGVWNVAPDADAV